MGCWRQVISQLCAYIWNSRICRNVLTEKPMTLRNNLAPILTRCFKTLHVALVSDCGKCVDTLFANTRPRWLSMKTDFDPTVLSLSVLVPSRNFVRELLAAVPHSSTSLISFDTALGEYTRAPEATTLEVSRLPVACQIVA